MADRTNTLTPIFAVTALIVGLMLAPLAADASASKKVYRIGYLQTSSREHQLHLEKAFKQGMQDLGYIEGRDVRGQDPEGREARGLPDGDHAGRPA